MAGLADATRGGKQHLVRDALRNAGRRLLKRTQPDEEGETDDEQHQHRPPSPPKERRGSAIPTATAPAAVAREPPAKLRKRSRNAMGHDNIVIHEDTAARIQHLHAPEFQIMTEHDPNAPYSDEDEDDQSEDEVDDTVAEDMRKLEENFKGISQKYRLINRIGEGMLVLPETRPLPNLLQARSQLSTRPNGWICQTRMTPRTRTRKPTLIWHL